MKQDDTVTIRIRAEALDPDQRFWAVRSNLTDEVTLVFESFGDATRFYEERLGGDPLIRVAEMTGAELDAHGERMAAEQEQRLSASTKTAIDVGCPRCGARPGWACRSDLTRDWLGVVCKQEHKERRVQLALELVQEDDAKRLDLRTLSPHGAKV